MKKDRDGCLTTMGDFLSDVFVFIRALYVLFVVGAMVSLPFLYVYKEGVLFSWVFPILFAVTAIISVILIVKNGKYKKRMQEVIKDYEQKSIRLQKDYEISYRKLNDKYDQKKLCLEKRESEIKRVIASNEPFRTVAEMAAELKTYLYEKDERYLRHKPHPAVAAADKIKEIRNACKESLVGYMEIAYKYNFILEKFPEIKLYVENDAELLSIAEFTSYSDIQDTRDRSRDFLNDEEWRNLTTTEKNQLALDRYIQRRKKSNWAIGRDYEMACAYSLRMEGYYVDMDGIEKRYEDLGRDLIATKFEKTLFGENHARGVIDIIQCKCWNKDMPIKENVLMQLYGTTVAYQIDHQDRLNKGIKVTPVLMIPPFTKLSDMAKSFAEILKIRIEIQDFVEFPRIKCNINGGEKIYHLPFDQQYDTAQIKNKGEFYAFTVKEAEEKGFRRAMRHQIANQHKPKGQRH